MKNFLLLIPLLCLLGLSSGVAQTVMVDGIDVGPNAVRPSDVAVLPYEVADILATIDDAENAPSEANAYVKMVLNDPTFPPKAGNSEKAANKYRWAKEDWIRSNPDKVEKLLIARKKNYDKYFNSGLQKAND